MVGACSTNGGEEEDIQIIGEETRGKGIIRKTKTRRGILLRWILQR
jgi:hypothetical protein